MNGHWHVANGLAGYGPDAADREYDVATDFVTLAGIIESELKTFSEMEYETAQLYGDSGEFEEAWKTLKRSEALDGLAANIAPSRFEEAPLYQGNDTLRDETIARLIAEHFPLDVTSNTRMYVWACNFVCDTDGSDEDSQPNA